jgi:tetratricopeptide (TPR) repeat protein
MQAALPYLVAAGIGVLIAHFITRGPELRSSRLTLLVLVPIAMVLCAAGGPATVLGVVFLAFLLAPSLAHYWGVGLCNFLDGYDWTPTEEELALRPIRLLIDKDNYREALAELDELLKKHKPTYEAVLTKAKLLHHIGRVDEAASTLPGLIALSNSAAQQVAVMELLTFLDKQDQDPPKPPAVGTRRIEIHHELVLFQLSGDTPPSHQVIPPGAYEVEETIHRNRLWLKLAVEDWGNAAVCWEAILTSRLPPVAPPKKGVFWQIVRMHQVIAIAIHGKPQRQLQAEAQALFTEAKKFIHRAEWQKAVPLLQKASACDPHRYEIAYRWVVAVRQTANDDAIAQAVNQVLQQSQWTRDEQDMLNQLKRPLAK